MNKKGQMEIAIIKGLILALAVVGGFLIYETIQAKTFSGQQIECKWDCSKVSWSNCIDGYSYRDLTLCKVNNPRCFESQPRPNSKANCT